SVPDGWFSAMELFESWMSVGAEFAFVVKENVKSAAMWSGGSIRSVSLISSLWTVMVQTVPAGRFVVGVSVNVVAGDEVCEKLSGVPVGHSIVNALLVALTDSLKLMSIVVSRATSVAPLAGVVPLTLGAASCVVNEKLVFEAG